MEVTKRIRPIVVINKQDRTPSDNDSNCDCLISLVFNLFDESSITLLKYVSFLKLRIDFIPKIIWLKLLKSILLFSLLLETYTSILLCNFLETNAVNRQSGNKINVNIQFILSI